MVDSTSGAPVIVTVPPAAVAVVVTVLYASQRLSLQRYSAIPMSGTYEVDVDVTIFVLDVRCKNDEQYEVAEACCFAAVTRPSTTAQKAAETALLVVEAAGAGAAAERAASASGM